MYVFVCHFLSASFCMLTGEHSQGALSCLLHTDNSPAYFQVIAYAGIRNGSGIWVLIPPVPVNCLLVAILSSFPIYLVYVFTV